MARLSQRIFSEIAISLIPLANAPSWVKALWVEKELEERGLWRDDVFELVRPFLVSAKATGRSDAQIPSVPSSRANSLLEPVYPRPEIVVSKPRLTEAEARWNPNFGTSESANDRPAYPGSVIDAEFEVTDTRHAPGGLDEQPLLDWNPEPGAGVDPDAGEVEGHSDISDPQLRHSDLKAEELTPEQSELASIMHMLAVSTLLDDKIAYAPSQEISTVSTKPPVVESKANAKSSGPLAVVAADSEPPVRIWSEERRPDSEIRGEFAASHFASDDSDAVDAAPTADLLPDAVEVPPAEIFTKELRRYRRPMLTRVEPPISAGENRKPEEPASSEATEIASKELEVMPVVDGQVSVAPATAPQKKQPNAAARASKKKTARSEKTAAPVAQKVGRRRPDTSKSDLAPAHAKQPVSPVNKPSKAATSTKANKAKTGPVEVVASSGGASTPKKDAAEQQHVKPVINKPAERVTRALSNSRKAASPHASKVSAARKPAPPSMPTQSRTTPVSTRAVPKATNPAPRYQQKPARPAKQSPKTTRDTPRKKSAAATRPLDEVKSIKKPKKGAKDLIDAISAAGTADLYGLHIDGSSDVDIGKLLFFDSVAKAEEGDWDGSAERLNAALDLLGDTPQTRIWKSVIEHSLKINHKLDRPAA